MSRKMITKEQKIDFINKIDFSGLFHQAEKFAGQKLVFEKPEIIETGINNICVQFQSNNINLSSCGIFGRILEYCRIENFGNSVYEDEKTGKIKFWVEVDISYQHLSGGSNGMTLFKAMYEDDEWTFKDVCN
jgi:hypothetical protein